jgi:chemotaxis protein histidine kinase CheA
MNQIVAIQSEQRNLLRNMRNSQVDVARQMKRIANALVQKTGARRRVVVNNSNSNANGNGNGNDNGNGNGNGELNTNAALRNQFMNFNQNYVGGKIKLSVNNFPNTPAANANRNARNLLSRAMSSNAAERREFNSIRKAHADLEDFVDAIENDTEQYQAGVFEGLAQITLFCKDPYQQFITNLNNASRQSLQDQINRQVTALFKQFMITKHSMNRTQTENDQAELRLQVSSLKQRKFLNANAVKVTANALAKAFTQTNTALITKFRDAVQREQDPSAFHVEVCKNIRDVFMGLEMALKQFKTEFAQIDAFEKLEKSQRNKQANKNQKKREKLAQQEAEKAAKKAEKEAKKAQKEAEKEAKKAQKNAEMLARRVQREAEAAARKDRAAENKKSKRKYVNHEADFQKLVQKFDIQQVTPIKKNIKKMFGVLHVVNSNNGRKMVVSPSELNAARAKPMKFRSYRDFHKQFRPQNKVSTLNYLRHNGTLLSNLKKQNTTPS